MNLIQQTLRLLGFEKSSSSPRPTRRRLRVERLESRELFAIGDGTLYYANEDGDRWYPPELRYDAATQEVVITAKSYKNLGLRAEVRDDGSGPRLDYWVPTEQSSLGKALPGDYVPTTFQSQLLSHKWLAGGRPVVGIRFNGSEGRDTFINDTNLPLQAWGHGGNDKLVGGQAVDKLYGGAGIDTLQGGDGDDFLYGGADGDILRGQQGNDVLRGEGGGDELFGGAGSDVLLGGEGSDLLFGDDDQNSQERLRLQFGVSGAVVVTRSSPAAATSNDILLGGEGRDFLHGQSGSDFLAGGAGSDELKGGDGNDHLFGDESPLVITPNLFRGRMSLTLSYSTAFVTFTVAALDLDSADAVRVMDPLGIHRGSFGDGGMAISRGWQVELFNKWAHRGDDRAVDTLFGEAGHDLMVGSNAQDLLFGSLGSDALFGGGGNDELDAGLPAVGELGDVTIGGEGFDTLVVAYWNDLTVAGRRQEAGDRSRPLTRSTIGDDALLGLATDVFENAIIVSTRESLLAGRL